MYENILGVLKTMQSFETVPLADIEEYIMNNDMDLPDEVENRYKLAFYLLNSGYMQNVPKTLKDYMIAYYIYVSDIDVPLVNLSSIIFGNTAYLANIPRLPDDKKRIIRIFQYLNKIIDDTSIFLSVPEDVLYSIMNTLNYDSVIEFCEVSRGLRNICQKPTFDNLIQRKRAEEITGINTSNLTSETIQNLLKYYTKQRIAASLSVLLVIMNNKLYGHGRLLYDLSDDERFERELEFFTANNLVDESINNLLVEIPLPETPVQVSLMKNENIFILTSNGNVYTFGISDGNPIRYPKKINGISNIIQISAQFDMAFFLSADGFVYTYEVTNSTKVLYDADYISYRQNNRSSTIVLSRIFNISKIVRIASGLTWTMMLNNTGQIYIMGLYNLDIPHYTDHPTLISFPGIGRIKNIYGESESHVAIVNENYELYIFNLAAIMEDRDEISDDMDAPGMWVEGPHNIAGYIDISIGREFLSVIYKDKILMHELDLNNTSIVDLNLKADLKIKNEVVDIYLDEYTGYYYTRVGPSFTISFGVITKKMGTEMFSRHMVKF